MEAQQTNKKDIDDKKSYEERAQQTDKKNIDEKKRKEEEEEEAIELKYLEIRNKVFTEEELSIFKQVFHDIKYVNRPANRRRYRKR